MFKSIAKLLLASLLSLIFITSNTLSFHKENGLTKTVETKWNGDPKDKKTFENEAKIKYCSFISSGKSKIIDGEPVFDETTKKQRISEDDNEPVFDSKEIFEIEISGYHLIEPRKAGSKLLPVPAFGSKEELDFNPNRNFDKIKLVELLKMYCLQDSKEEKPAKFKGSYLEKFYEDIAKDNGFLKKNSEEGDYNKKLIDGPHGNKILKEGIIINNPDAVWYVPDFLIQKDKEIKKATAKKIADDKKEADRLAIIAATKKGNKQWISENKQKYIDQFNKKLNEYETLITEITSKRNWLITQLSNFETLVADSNDKVENAIDDLVNTGNDQVKSLRNKIRENRKIYLSNNHIKEYKNRLKKIENKDFSKYERYLTLKDLITRTKKSKKVENFVGKDSTEIFGITFKQSEIGFIQEFDNIKNKKLGSGSIEDQDNMSKLSDEMLEHVSDINEFILEPVTNLITLDNAIQNKTPWAKYATYIAIFLAIVGVIIYVFIQQRNMRRLREESEEKVGSLKNEFEGKLRNTSEQIRSVSRNTARRQQQGGLISDPEPAQEIQKAPEEIAIEKYKELVTDYKEALEDFAKVATFKDKWHGLPLSRKERQDGSKTILISSTRAFEKAGIWCVNFDDKYFAFPGSTVKSNMATYMNMDFMKAGQDFKGVFSISTGATYSTEPSQLRRGGAGFVVEGIGKIIFPE